MNSQALGTSLTVALLVIGCGMTDPKYVDYSGSSGTATGTSTSTCAQAAAAEYTSKVAPVVNATCSGASCHGGAQTLAGEYLKTGDDAHNRKQLLKYANGNADKLIDKYTANNGQTHGGGPLGTTLTPVTMKGWLDKEFACSK